MDLAQTLVRSVARAFYDTRHILVIDALMIHSALPNEDLALLLGMQQKDLRKLCGKLREDKLLSVHSRQETREGMQRPIHRDYYYVDLHAAVDAIKFRVWHLTKRVQDLYKPSEEKKDYACGRCKSKFTVLDVQDSFDHALGGFRCHRCGWPLTFDEVSAADRAGHERQSRLMAQLHRLLDLLKRIDQADVPRNDFAAALERAIPVRRDPAQYAPSAPYVPVKAEPNGAAAAAARPAHTVAAGDVDVQVLSASNAGAADGEAAAAKKAQNALPVWHTQSTVDAAVAGAAAAKPDSDLAGSGNPARPRTNGVAPKAEDDEDAKPPTSAGANGATMDPLAAYYAEMQQERLREEAARGHSSGSGDEEDDDDGFEDVAIGAGGAGGGGASGVDTPSSSMSGGPSSSAPPAAKPPGGESPGASTSGAGTPAELEGASPAKRVKLDPEANLRGGSAGAPPADDGDSDEDEFEDVA